jgi:hypothetical protein
MGNITAHMVTIFEVAVTSLINGHSMDLCLNSFFNSFAIGQKRYYKLDAT